MGPFFSEKFVAKPPRQQMGKAVRGRPTATTTKSPQPSPAKKKKPAKSPAKKKPVKTTKPKKSPAKPKGSGKASSSAKKVTATVAKSPKPKIAKKAVKKKTPAAAKKSVAKTTVKPVAVVATQPDPNDKTTQVVKIVKKSSSKIKSEAPPIPISQDDYPTAYGPISGFKKIVSWNVNSINAALKKGAKDYVDKESVDILCLQETKANPESIGKINQELGSWPHAYFSCSQKKGYAGTAILSKIRPENVYYGLEVGNNHEQDGRVIIAEFKEFLLVNTYVPNAGMKLENLSFRGEWDQKLRERMAALSATRNKPILWTGDLNVAHTDWDLARPDERRNKVPGATDQERESFAETLKNNKLVDLWRSRNSEPRLQHFTFWSYKFQAKQKNNGWRLDYWCASESLASRLGEIFFRTPVASSDHCPIGILIEEQM